MKEQDLFAYMHDYVYSFAEYGTMIEKAFLTLNSGQKINPEIIKKMRKKTLELEKFGKVFRKRSRELTKEAQK